MANVQRYFVGTYSRIMDTPFEFKKFGQLVEMPEELATGHPHLVTPEVWDAQGFTSDEKTTRWFDNISAHRDAPPEFIAKRNALWALAYEENVLMKGKTNA